MAFNPCCPARMRLLRALAAALLLSASGRSAWGLTIAVTGDVSGPDDGIVSDAILADPSVVAVLLAGDTDNASRTPLSGYQELYKGGFGRLLSKIYPCPGNHDAYSHPPFSGYLAFWRSAGRAERLYYSFDLGGWHIVSLDSPAIERGGPEAAAQLDWLKNDLAAKPKAPTLVFWHFPLFSRAKHCGDARMKPLWEAFYAHGPALVINGHNHVYERYAPMDPEGRPAAQTRGIREFVISPAGSGPAEKQCRKASGPAPERFHGGTQHVGFFALEADGSYRFTVKSVSGKGLSEVVDAGAGRLSEPPAPRRD